MRAPIPWLAGVPVARYSETRSVGEWVHVPAQRWGLWIPLLLGNRAERRS